MKENIKIYVIPSSITGDTLANTLRAEDLEIIKKLDLYIVETAKIARRHLSGLDLEKPIQEVEMYEVNEHTRYHEMVDLLEEIIEKGKNIGLMSDAGSPSIADPGWRAIQYAQSKGIEIVPLSGPSSIFLALMASGLNGQRFVFHGYLSKDKQKRGQDIKKIERDSRSKNQTQIFMEVPYKNEHILQDILNVCDGETYLCIAQDVQGENQILKTKKIFEWRKENVKLMKSPCIFLLYAGR